MALAQLSIDLVAKVAAFERDIKRTADATVAQSQRMAVAFDLIKGGIAGIAAGFSAGALVTFVRTTVDAVDALNDVADATGATVENISALEDVAKRTGTNLDAVSGILVKFNSVLADADPTKGAGAVIKALNLDIEDLKRLDPAEALRQVAVALSGYADDGNKARAVQELFGKSVKEAAPFLKDLAENGQLNAKVTSEQAAQAEKFNKELFKLQTNANDAARAIVGSLVPAINRIFDDVRTLGDQIELGGLASDVNGLASQLKQLQNIKISAVFVPSDIDKQIADVQARLEAAQKKFKSALGPSPRDALRAMDRNIPWKELKLPDDKSGGGGSSGGNAAAKDPYAEANRYLETLRKQAQATQELTVYEKLLADLRVGALGKTTPAIESQLKDLARQIDADKEISDITKQFADLEKASADKRKALMDEGRGFYEATRTPIERLNIELARQDELLRKLGPAYKDVYMRANEAAQERYESETKATEQLDAMSQAAIQASERIQGALGDELTNILSGEFDNIGDAFSRLIERMLAEAAAAKIMEGLFGKVGSDGKRSGGGLLDDAAKWLGSIIPSANGNVFPSGPGISAYSSQIVTKPTIFPFAKGIGLMGEAGAEAIMPLRRDAAGRLGVTAAGIGSGSVTVQIINNGQPMAVTRQQESTGADGGRLIQITAEALANDVDNGSGPLTRAIERRFGLRTSMA